MPLDAILISCTGSSYLLGKEGDRDISRKMAELTGVPTITSSFAIQEALSALGVKALTLISPYPAWLTKQSADYWGGSGFRLQTKGGPVNPGVWVGFNPQPEPPGDFAPTALIAATRTFWITPSGMMATG